MYRTYLVENMPQTRIDRFLRRRFPSATQGQIEKWLRSKDILVNDQKVESSHRVSDFDTVQIKEAVAKILENQKQLPLSEYIPDFDRSDAEAVLNMVLYEDEELLILNKPSGLATQGGTKTSHHMDKMLKSYEFFYCKNTTLRLVHRLDRDTSGVLVVAKSLKAAHNLSNQFKETDIQKVYWAVSYGKISPLHGIINAPLLKKSHHSGGESVVVDVKDGKKAQTAYRVVKSFSDMSWFELRPETGRTHQIRVHLAHVGNPILGDTKYGPKRSELPEDLKELQLHLHSRSLRLKTLDGDTMTFTAPPPDHMVETFAHFAIEWEKYA